ncbi:MAG TPA: efflux RND transporter periplasmic adaptor subunit [Burkholderiales bacterium]
MHIARVGPLRTSALALAAAWLLASCSAEQPAPTAPTRPVVTVVTVQPESVPVTAELPGRTLPYLVAEVRPQVTGIIKKRLFTEGSEVKAGQVLYQIDPAPYQAAYDSAEANLARAKANLEAARIKAARYAELVAVEAVSKQENDDAQAALKQAAAEVDAAKAALEKARLDLEYTRVRAPIGGIIGRSAVTPGALVTANQPEALATIQQLDPIYVDLTQSSAELLRLRRDLKAGRLERVENGTVPVKLVLEDGSEHPAEGRLAFSEVSVDQTTGTVTLRAVFPNPGGELLPGMYVRARLTHGVNRDAILVPHAAVARNPRGQAQVLVVNGEGKVEARIVRADRALGDKWVVTDGLAAGDRVIVAGLQRVRPGDLVQAEEAGARHAQGREPTLEPVAVN